MGSCRAQSRAYGTMVAVIKRMKVFDISIKVYDLYAFSFFTAKQLSKSKTENFVRDECRSDTDKPLRPFRNEKFT